MSFNRPLITNSTDCRINITCNNNGICQENGWCLCDLGYNTLNLCELPFFTEITKATQYGLITLAFISYTLLWGLFIIELIHHIVAHGIKGALYKNFTGWVCLTSIIFIFLRVCGFVMLAIDFSMVTANLQSSIWIINTIGLSILGCVFVLCTTLWLNLIQHAKNIGTTSRFFKICKLINLILMGVGIPLGILCSILSAVGFMSVIMATIAQLFATIAVLVPLLIIIVCLIRSRKYLQEQEKMVKTKEINSNATKILIVKTKVLIAVIVLLICVFIWTFGTSGFDGEMPGVIMLKYYSYPVVDFIIMSIFWYFAQKYAHGPMVPLFKNFFTIVPTEHTQVTVTLEITNSNSLTKDITDSKSSTNNSTNNQVSTVTTISMNDSVSPETKKLSTITEVKETDSDKESNSDEESVSEAQHTS